MKNVLSYIKVLVIILLCAGAIGGTVFLFYSTHKTKPNAFDDMNAFAYGGERSQIESYIYTVDDLASRAPKNNTNLGLIKITNSKLDEINSSLFSYFVVANNHGVEDKVIISALNQLKAAQSASILAAREYLSKSQGAGFDMAVGANDVFVELANYLVKYSNYLSILNQSVGNLGVNVNLDVKFSVIDLYLNIVAKTFELKNIVVLNNFKTLKSSSNLEAFQGESGEKLNFENSYLSTSNNFSFYNNEFINAYKLCNKETLVANFALLLQQYGNEDLSEAAQPEQKVVICFKNIFGN